MNRREFLAAAAAAPLAAADQRVEVIPAWCDRPMRWAQLTLVENDPGQYDPQFWLDYFHRTHSDAACLSAGGCVAYYPTKVPLHHRSKWMKDTDPFGTLVAGCRKLGMNVIARTDPHAARQDVFDAHPDWIAVDADGKKRRHWADPAYYVTCALGPYNFEFMTAVTAEIAKLYDVDGIFSNRWDGSGMCYCEHCKANFRAATGLELPRTTDPADRARRAYIEWRQDRLFQLWDVWDRAIREHRPNARFIPNTGGGATSSLDMARISSHASILFADRQARRGLMPPWMSGKNGKEYRSTMGRKPIGGIFSVGVEEPYRWKDSVQNPEEIKLWVAEATANGLRPWFTKFSGTLYDKRWLKTVEEIYDWHWRNERYLRNEAPIARVGLVFSQRTGHYYGGDQARTKVEDHALGWYQALIEARIPFEMVYGDALPWNHGFKTLILPNIAAMSDDACSRIKEFVANGGSIIATHETSLYDGWGQRRPDFGLASLFGASYAGRVEGPMQNSYLTIEADPSTKQYHPLVHGLEDATRIINGVRRVVVTPAGAKPRYSPLTLIPSYPDLPMEQVYPRVPHTDEPEVYLSSEPGRGRVVYFPWDIDRTYWEVLSTDHGRILRNAVRWATAEPSPVEVTGPGLLDVTAWRQKNSLTVHLVNLTNPMTMKGPVRETYPIGPLDVTIRVPEALNAKRVRLLTSQAEPHSAKTPDGLRVAVPQLQLHEVIAIDL